MPSRVAVHPGATSRVPRRSPVSGQAGSPVRQSPAKQQRPTSTDRNRVQPSSKAGNSHFPSEIHKRDDAFAAFRTIGIQDDDFHRHFWAAFRPPGSHTKLCARDWVVPTEGPTAVPRFVAYSTVGGVSAAPAADSSRDDVTETSGFAERSATPWFHEFGVSECLFNNVAALRLGI